MDTDVLIHSLVNQNTDLHLKANNIIEALALENRFSISWLSIQEVGFVPAKLRQSESFIISKVHPLMSAMPIQYGLIEFTRAIELAKIIGFKDFNDCLHTAIAEQYCSDIYTCNYKDFMRIQPHTSLSIHFL
ncbi:PIN domain-containing protein [Pedobacter sp. BS3]|uniref:PIN domain-containing protein n=1 Tax=Pedobacter sp. BS3 TaxID=2567937 RepID=UPI0021D13C1D|nr:PIN domain-containing protein [Pedobacter sp. BS3]